MTGRQILGRDVLILLALTGWAAALPAYASEFVVSMALTCLMYVALSSSWSLFCGSTGYMSLATSAFFGVGAYTGGNGHIYVRVKYRCFPIVERDIYYVDESFADEETDDYLYWLDDDTLYISETEEEVEVGRY